MLNAETKRHIDAARDVLVGVAPNPMTQIDQITYALIYKFMDDMDQAAIKAGGDPSFFTGDLEPYAWSSLVDSRMGNQEKMNLYGEALQKFAEAKQLPELFRTIFRSAFLPYRSPETLGLFLKEINFFDYTHPEELGNAYEYLLSIMSAQGDAGQFRTPRHIIDFIVDVINPTKDDTVLDPACGTGGFLVSSYNHILEQHKGKSGSSNQEKPLTPDERKKLMNNLEGYDIDPSMVRIAQVNMYLHQFKNPKIFQYDSLTNEERWNDKFDVILANPPFMTPKGGIKPHSKFGIQANRSEVLFVDYIMNHLRPNGRAGIIVPEGIIFQSGKAYKQLRKRLVEDGLYAVISLPSGVFQPYSGVKTSILLINKSHSINSDRVLFLQLRSLGISLGAARNLISENDLPEAEQILFQFLEGNHDFESNFAFSVSKKIIEDKDFNLSSSIYRDSVKVNSGYAFTRIIDVCAVSKGKSSSTKTDKGSYPLYLTAEYPKPASHFDFSGEGVAVPLISATGHGKADVKRIHYVNGEFALANLLAFVEPRDRSSLDPKYLFHVLNGNKAGLASLMKGAANVTMKVSDLENFMIPIPTIEVQKQIVAELDGYAAIIDGAKKIVENWRPRIEIDEAWEMIRLGDLVEVLDSKRKPITKSDRVAGPYPYYGATGIVDHVADYIFNEPLVLVGEDGAKWASGEATAFMVEGKCWVNNHAHVIRPNRNKLFDLYLTSYLTQLDLTPFITGVTVPKLNQEKLKSIEIPVPPLDIQKIIAEQLRIELDGVEASKRLLESTESRISKIIDTLWS
jgi:type I restriction enzyme M protein